MGGKTKTFERVKRLAGLGSPEEWPYRCLNCQRGYEVQYHVCPDCGSFSVESAE